MIHRLLGDMAKAMHRNMIPDPGDAGTLAPRTWGICPLVSATAETRTLADPAYAGQLLLMYLKTDGGDITMTASSGVNPTGNTTITWDTAGECLLLMAVESGSSLVWRIVGGTATPS